MYDENSNNRFELLSSSKPLLSFHSVLSFFATRVKEVEELCKGNLESVYSLYPTLSRLQAIGELENIGELFSRYVIHMTL